MKVHLQRHIYFAGKSLLWATILYCTSMVVLNWEDVVNKLHTQGTAGVVRIITPLPAPPSTINVYSNS